MVFFLSLFFKSEKVSCTHDIKTIASHLFTMKNTRIRPQYDDLEGLDFSDQRSHDEMEEISFGALNKAQKLLMKESRDEKEDESDEEGFFESESDSAPEELSSKSTNTKQRSKHAPAESSSKRPVSRIRDIPGLEVKNNSRFGDIRFDPAFGKANEERIRKDYSFLNEYREKELQQMQSMLKDKKLARTMSQRERQELELQAQSLRSRLDSMKNKELETKVLADYKKEQREKWRLGEQTGPYFLKRADKRKLLQKAKFDSMKAPQREKVMERKRKRRLGREMRQLEFGRK